LAHLQEKHHEVLTEVHPLQIQMVSVGLELISRLELVEIFAASAEIKGPESLRVGEAGPMIALLKLLGTHQIELRFFRGQGDHIVVIWIDRVVHEEGFTL